MRAGNIVKPEPSLDSPLEIRSELKAMAYALGVLASLHWQRWEEEWVLFDEGSGQTVLLDTLSAATLMMLDCSPTTLGTLKEQLIEELKITETEGFSDMLQDHLESMIKLGLVESSPC